MSSPQLSSVKELTVGILCIRLAEWTWPTHLFFPYTEIVILLPKLTAILQSKNIAQPCAPVQQCSYCLCQNIHWHTDWSSYTIYWLSHAGMAPNPDQQGTDEVQWSWGSASPALERFQLQFKIISCTDVRWAPVSVSPQPPHDSFITLTPW